MQSSPANSLSQTASKSNGCGYFQRWSNSTSFLPETFLKCDFNPPPLKGGSVLAGVTKWLEHKPTHQRVTTGLIPSQYHLPVCRFDPATS